MKLVLCVYVCWRPGKIHPNGNSDDHWGGPGTGGWGGKERWSGETPNCNCCVNMSIFYKLAGEMLSAGDDREQPWLDLVGIVTDSHVRGSGSARPLWPRVPIHRATEALF